MSELRQDPLSGRWFVLAAERARRPEAFHRPARQWTAAGDCPFCPGNETMTTNEVLRYEDGDGNWHVRIVPNKYADMADPAGDTVERGERLFRSKPSAGFADVLIESRQHDVTFANHPPRQATRIVQAIQERYQALRDIPGLAVIMPFRNYLQESGASLGHPHGQILASSHLPPVLELEATRFAALEGCLGCDLAAAEADGPRVISEVGDYLILAPYASRSAFEILILPRRCAPDPAGVDPEAFAAALQDAYGRLNRVLADPPTNMWIHSRPLPSASRFHWHAHLMPRLTVEGAWELGSGLAVNVVAPEQAAAALQAG
jgi:UDPglucose--hexose-1-phosphate uridylyltransferase